MNVLIIGVDRQIGTGYVVGRLSRDVLRSDYVPLWRLERLRRPKVLQVLSLQLLVDLLVRSVTLYFYTVNLTSSHCLYFRTLVKSSVTHVVILRTSAETLLPTSEKKKKNFPLVLSEKTSFTHSLGDTAFWYNKRI